jgi:hypothetical protein
MMNDNWLDIILNISVWSVAKVLMLIALVIYLIFAVVVIRQVSVMTKVVSGRLNIPLRLISWAHLIFTLLVIILSIVIL